MNTGFERKNIIYKYVTGVTNPVAVFDFTSNPNATAIDLVNATGMSLQRANELIAERVVLNLVKCPTSSISVIQFEAITYTVTEPNVGVTMVDIVLKRTNGCDGGVTATVNRTGGTATVTSDFTNIFPTTVTWLDGDCTNKIIQVPIVGDSVQESTETMILQITDIVGNGVIGSLNTTTINILDNDLYWNVLVEINSTSNCTPIGNPVYPFTQTVLNNTSYNVPINTSGCTLTNILIDNVNVSSLELSNAIATGFYTLSNITSNKSVQLVYSNVVVPCSNFQIKNAAIPDVYREETYNTQLEATGGNSLVTWSVTTNGSNGFGLLDSTLELTSSGLLRNKGSYIDVCANKGTYTSIITAVDSTGCSVSKSFIFTCLDRQVVIYPLSNSIVTFDVGVYKEVLITVSPQLTVQTPNITFALFNSVLPAGLFFTKLDNYNAKISGVATAPSSSTIQIQWRDDTFGGCNRGQSLTNYNLVVF